MPTYSTTGTVKNDTAPGGYPLTFTCDGTTVNSTLTVYQAGTRTKAAGQVTHKPSATPAGTARDTSVAPPTDTSIAPEISTAVASRDDSTGSRTGLMLGAAGLSVVIAGGATAAWWITQRRLRGR